jgi:hypothetical protein
MLDEMEIDSLSCVVAAQGKNAVVLGMTEMTHAGLVQVPHR